MEMLILWPVSWNSFWKNCLWLFFQTTSALACWKLSKVQKNTFQVSVSSLMVTEWQIMCSLHLPISQDLSFLNPRPMFNCLWWTLFMPIKAEVMPSVILSDTWFCNLHGNTWVRGLDCRLLLFEFHLPSAKLGTCLQKKNKGRKRKESPLSVMKVCWKSYIFLQAPCFDYPEQSCWFLFICLISLPLFPLPPHSLFPISH